MSEVKRFYINGRDWEQEEDPSGDLVLASDYDALAAQHDEGLAREAELHQLLADLRDYIRPNSVLNPEGVAVKLKTRIDQVLLSLPIFEMVQRTECCAEAAWLLFDRNFYDQYGLLVMTSAEIIQRATSYAGYTGCADGENRIERGSEHGFEQSPNSCRHDEKIGVWWREWGVTRTGRECVACGHVDEDGCADGEKAE